MTTIKGGRGVVSRIVYLVSLVLLVTACGPEPEKEIVVRPVKAMRVADSSGLMERAFPGRAKAGLEVNSVIATCSTFPYPTHLKTRSNIV